MLQNMSLQYNILTVKKVTQTDLRNLAINAEDPNFT